MQRHDRYETIKADADIREQEHSDVCAYEILVTIICDGGRKSYI